MFAEAVQKIGGGADWPSDAWCGSLLNCCRSVVIELVYSVDCTGSPDKSNPMKEAEWKTMASFMLNIVEIEQEDQQMLTSDKMYKLKTITNN